MIEQGSVPGKIPAVALIFVSIAKIFPN